MATKKLKVGDRIRLTRLDENDIAHGFKLGAVYTINYFSGATLVSVAENEEGCLYSSQVELVTPELELELVPIETPAYPPSGDLKDTNPKDAAATNRLPLDLVPDTLQVFAALAFAEGAAKYGSCNWRVAGVRASVYRAAIQRHLIKWWNGEEADPKTGVPHLASVMSGCAILLDSALVGKLTDDRPPKAPMGELIDSLESKVASIRELFKDKHPHHHTALNSAPNQGPQ